MKNRVHVCCNIMCKTTWFTIISSAHTGQTAKLSVIGIFIKKKKKKVKCHDEKNNGKKKCNPSTLQTLILFMQMQPLKRSSNECVRLVVQKHRIAQGFSAPPSPVKWSCLGPERVNPREEAGLSGCGAVSFCLH